MGQEPATKNGGHCCPPLFGCWRYGRIVNEKPGVGATLS